MKQKNPPENRLIYCIRHHGLLPTLRTRLRRAALRLRWLYLTRVWHMDIHPNTLISLKVNLDRTHPRGIHIDEGTNIAFDTVILTHDLVRDQFKDTRIGKYCGIGARSFIMPGVTIGDHCVIGACSVVTKDVPANSMAVGNPARIIRTGITTGNWGKIIDAGTSVKP